MTPHHPHTRSRVLGHVDQRRGYGNPRTALTIPQRDFDRYAAGAFHLNLSLAAYLRQLISLGHRNQKAPLP